jgi:hypothetical protein
MELVKFRCECGMKGCVLEDEKTKPCPKCGRVYECFYSPYEKELVVELLGIEEIK